MSTFTSSSRTIDTSFYKFNYDNIFLFGISLDIGLSDNKVDMDWDANGYEKRWSPSMNNVIKIIAYHLNIGKLKAANAWGCFGGLK